MMNRLIVYFHGFGSNSKTPKVAALTAAFPNDTVVAFDIDIDTNISLGSYDLTNKIDDALIAELHSIKEVIFVGTSLGAWYAGTLARIYDVRCILINPSFNPAETLKKYNISADIREGYIPLDPAGLKAEYFFALHDEVIDNSLMIPKLKNVTIVKNADHRFNDNFDIIIDALNN